jgi:hypothetical protein
MTTCLVGKPPKAAWQLEIGACRRSGRVELGQQVLGLGDDPVLGEPSSLDPEQVMAAEADDDPDGKDARRPPTERQVGETWRKRPVTSQQQTAADAALRRQLARERFSIPSGTPARVPAPVRTAEPSGQPGGWLVLGFAVIAALALVAGLAVMAARRASRKVRAGQAA